MKVTQKKVSGGRVEIVAIATADEVNRAFLRAEHAFAQQMNLAPQRDKTISQIAYEAMGIKDLDSVIESQVLDFLWPQAVDKSGFLPSFPPKPLPSSSLKRGKEFSFRLSLTPKPLYSLTSYDPVEITVPEWSPDKEPIQKQLDTLRDQYASYVADDPHPLRDGDSCLISLVTKKNGEEVSALSSKRRTYVVGQHYLPGAFDDEIIGMEVGQSKSFSFEGPGLDDDFNEITETFDTTVTLIELQKKVLPELNDEWVAKFMPSFHSAQELKDRIEKDVIGSQRRRYDEYVRGQAAAVLAERFEGKIENAVYESMQKSLAEDTRHRLQAQGKSYEDFITEQGGEQQFNMMLMFQARSTLTQGYALDALFMKKHLVVRDEDIDDVCYSMNPYDPAAIRRELESSGRGFALRESAERMRANKYLVEHAIIHYTDEKTKAGKNPEVESISQSTAD